MSTLCASASGGPFNPECRACLQRRHIRNELLIALIDNGGLSRRRGCAAGGIHYRIRKRAAFVVLDRDLERAGYNIGSEKDSNKQNASTQRVHLNKPLQF